MRYLIQRKFKVTYPSCFKSNGELISDPTCIATSFSKCFSNIGPNLSARILPSTANFRDLLSQTTQTPLEFQPLAADELKTIVHSFNSYKTSGVDNIPVRIIKLAADELKTIVHSFNSYKTSGVDNIPMRIIKLIISALLLNP